MLKKLFIFLFAIFVATDSFATTDIASNAESSTCNDTVLGTTEGDVNFDAKWQANNIQLRWYNQGELLSVQTAAQTCNYDGALTIPSTEPERTGYTFAGWTVVPGVPSGYTQLQYIQSDGGQYIDTGIVPSNNTGFIIDLQYTASDSGEQIAIGSYNPNFLVDRVERRFYFAYKQGTGLSNSTSVLTPEVLKARHKIELNWKNNGIFRMGNTIKVLNVVNFAGHVPVYIFSCGGYTSKNMIGRVYSTKISNNTDMVRDFIPARRNSDNEVGMWDTVSETFFTNAGSGTFTAGPDAQ